MLAVTGQDLENRATHKASQRHTRSTNSLPILWYDTTKVPMDTLAQGVMEQVLTRAFTGLLVVPEDLGGDLVKKFHRHQVIVRIDGAEDLVGIEKWAQGRNIPPLVVLSSSDDLLEQARGRGFETCVHMRVHDKASLHRAIAQGARHPYLVMRFQDPTNIPLELVIAELQRTSTVVLKEIEGGEGAGDVLNDDILNSMGTMEFGVEGFLVTPMHQGAFDTLLRRMDETLRGKLALETAEIIETRPVKDGIRGCIDLSSLFSQTEGMIVGSTSQGGFLCCPEVFEMPYMNKREFRINAGGVHSYVFGPNNRTVYLSEVRTGDDMMVVGLDGTTRTVPLGRVKLEKRPLRLVRARFATQEEISILLQDDWHVRIYSPEGTPINITELRVGTKVCAHKAVGGRHVGVPVTEYIQEF